MSVDIVKTNGKIYVAAKPNNSGKDSEAALIECKNMEEANEIKKEVEGIEKQIQAEIGNVELNHGTKPKGVGEKLDVKAA